MRSEATTLSVPECACASPADPTTSIPRPTVSADSAATTAPSPASQPLFGRAAIAILGTMVFLIIALSVVLVQTTWVDPAGATEAPVVITPSFAQN